MWFQKTTFPQRYSHRIRCTRSLFLHILHPSP